MPLSIALAAYLVSSAVASAPSPGELSEMVCVLAKDPGACEASYRRSEKSPDGLVFARAGCEEGKSARLCANFGDALAHERAADVDIVAAYERGCTDESGLGCLRLLERMAAGAESDLPKADLLVRRACDPRGGIQGQCSVAQAARETIRRRGDGGLFPCHTEIQIFQTAGAASRVQVLPEGPSRDQPRSKDECETQCAKAVANQYAADASDLVARGRCKWGSSYLKTRLKSLTGNARCPNDSRAMGTNADRLFARCHCENPVYEAANAIADAHGAFVRAEVAYAKKFGTTTWYRCGAQVRFDDESVLASPTCATKRAELNKALAAEPTLADVQLNFKAATCKGARK